jgi:lipoic acid synthetase
MTEIIKGCEVARESKRVIPSWLKRKIAYSGKHNSIRNNIHAKGLHTVCLEAKCPNRSECYSRGVATFLIMGNVCTRNCSFCSVSHGTPQKLNPLEPDHIVEATIGLNLKHVVITSVTRDDLFDGGASVYALIVKRLRDSLPDITIELLIPDFKGDPTALDTVFNSRPDVLNHNVETVPQLYPVIRPQASFQRSLEVLKRASEKGLITKSGIMVGLGEKYDEVIQTMDALRRNGCSILTIGQYLQPSANQIKVSEFVHPEVFEKYSIAGKEMGFSEIFAGPYVRSSYRADELWDKVAK